MAKLAAIGREGHTGGLTVVYGEVAAGHDLPRPILHIPPSHDGYKS